MKNGKHRYLRVILICIVAGFLTAGGLFSYALQVRGGTEPAPAIEDSNNQVAVPPAPEIDNQVEVTPQPKPTEITISAVGDCTLGYDYRYPIWGRFDTTFKSVGYNYGYFFSKVQPIFAADDLTIINLETTLTRTNNRINKGKGLGYWFKGDPTYTEIMKKGSVEAAFVANNHSYDYGAAGFKDTLANLNQAGITAFGYDRKIVTNIKGVNVALLGYNLVDYIQSKIPVSSVQQRVATDIQAVRANNGANLVVVVFHWGVEGKTKAHPWQVALGHSAIDSGADLVLGHHPHVIQGIERYHGKIIVYSLGNFCFGGNLNPGDKDTFIYQQKFVFNEKNQCVDYTQDQVIPCLLSSTSNRNDYCPMPVQGPAAQRIHSRTGL